MGMGSFGYFWVTVIQRTFSLGFSFRSHFHFGIDIASAINGNNIYIPDIPFVDRAFSDIRMEIDPLIKTRPTEQVPIGRNDRIPVHV
jgi:hypothetical protein